MIFIPPLFVYVSGWLLGIALAPYLPQPVWVGLSLFGLGLFAAIVARRKVKLHPLAIVAVMFGLGAARWGWAQPVFDNSFIAAYNDKGAVTLEGVVVDEPDVRDTYVNLRVAVEALRLEGAAEAIPVQGLVLVQAPRFPALNYGARIRAQGNLQTPPEFEDFSYKDYLAHQGVFSILRQAQATPIKGDIPGFWLRLQVSLFRPIYSLKSFALDAIARTFPEPQGSLLSGILLGVDSGVPPSLQEAFRATGTSHILAISGFNVSVLVGIFARLFQKVLGKKWSVPVTIVVIAGYTILAGADASVVRAALMGSLVLVADGFNRPSHGLASLAAASFAMTLYNPGLFWDVGFQLSAAATLGLIMYAEPFTQATTRWLARFIKIETAQRIVGAVGEFSLLTLAAQVTTLPLMAYYFHQISIISLLANLLVLPVQPQVMILGGIATMGAMIQPTLGYWLYWLAWPFVTFTIVVIELLAKAPLAAIAIDRFSVAVLMGMYGILFGLTWLLSREESKRPKWLPSPRGWLANACLALLAISALVAWNVYLHRPDGKLHLTFLDVGHGDAILIQTSTGRYALIDGGPSPNALAEALGRNLPVTARTLDLVIAASPKPDSLGGLPGLLSRYEIKQAVMAGAPQRSSTYREWAEGIASRNIPVASAAAGQHFDLGAGAELVVVEVSSEGATLRLEYGNASFLFPLDLNAKTATGLTSSGQVTPATVLLAPAQGGKDSLSALFLDAAQPAAIVIPVGAGNAEGDPQPQMLALFEGRTVLRTDQHGPLNFASDGQQLWVTTGR